ncbi:MAG: O-antigen ligase family protein [Bacteroidaceae bacterium]|nr:O-antigen ligase family protein [Bacteroidaceae bacterium]
MKILTIFCKIGKAITLFFCLILILQPLFADWQALNADAGQAGAWAMLYRYGSIGVVGLWTACLLIPRRVVRRLPDVASFVLMGCVIWEAVVALNQLYGDGMSNHALYRFTGTFLNPGPFSGFLAIGVPLAVNYLLVDKGRVDKLTRYKLTRPSGTNSSSTRQLVNSSTKTSSTIASLICQLKNGLALTTLFLCLLLLPAGMSRSAWMAATTGAMVVYGMHRWRNIREWCGTLLRSLKRLMAVGAILVLCIGMGWGAFHLKEDSANGRLFMWKMACHAIAEKPWTGYGAEGFPMAYAEAQEQYFAHGQGTDEEIYVAGTPDNAFNEYLTITVKYGLIGLGVILIIGIVALACAICQRAYGIAGALVTVAVFAFASYPFQLPDFLSAVILLVAVPLCHLLRYGLHNLRTINVLIISHKESSLTYEIIVIFFAVLSIGIVVNGVELTRVWQVRHEAAKEWRNARSLYHMEAYSVVCEDYAPLYERMKWNHNYLFEYGRALHQTEKFRESNQILKEAEQICGDPMILNIQGKNHEALGEFDQAARLYRRAYHRLPNRLYPLYLEMEMYASPACNRPEAAKEIAQRILDTKEKVPSKAVEEMKERAREVMKIHEGVSKCSLCHSERSEE